MTSGRIPIGPYPDSAESNPHPLDIPLIFILIVLSQVQVCLQLTIFMTKMLYTYAFSIFPMLATCSPHRTRHTVRRSPLYVFFPRSSYLIYVKFPSSDFSTLTQNVWRNEAITYAQYLVSSAVVVINLRRRPPRKQASVSGRDKKSLSSPRLSDFFGGPHSPFSSGKQVPSASLKQPAHEKKHPVQRRGKNAWKYSFTPLYFSGLVVNTCRVHYSFIIVLLSTIKLRVL